MKIIYSLILCCMFLPALGKNSTFDKVAAVNKCWNEQTDIVRSQLPAYTAASETEWIRRHLSLVEQTLRKRATERLTASQKHNRATCLDNLHSYWQAGNFPINENYTYRTPIFIDKHDNFCAVGYLVKASGHEAISRMIAANTNLAYVREMKYPQLTDWANENGFTVDELAWIQPSYPSTVHSAKVGNGVDSEVRELFVDTTDSRLYVGGIFKNADSTLLCNNIAYVTQSGKEYTWHNMGTGVNGPVNAIIKYDNKIFAAGMFSTAGGSPADNVAYWDGSTWHSAGCISGYVNNMVVYKGALYAAGSFEVCGGTPNVNFANWDGASWQQIPGLEGTINTMQVMDTMLLLGGSFTYGATATNAIKWNKHTGFIPFAHSVYHEVKDFEIFKDTVYAVCKPIDTTNYPMLLMKLKGVDWQPIYDSVFMSYLGKTAGLSFNTLCSEQSSINAGGNYGFSFMMSSLTYCMNIMPDFSYSCSQDCFTLDNYINKIILFNGELIAGGVFKFGYNAWPWGAGSKVRQNGIALRNANAMSLRSNTQPGSFSLYPNPVISGNSITIGNNINASHFTIRDINSKLIEEGSLNGNGQQIFPVPLVAPGIYTLEVSNKEGLRSTHKLEIQ